MPKKSTMGGSIQWNVTLGRREAELVQALADLKYERNRSRAMRAIVRMAEPLLDAEVRNAKPVVLGGRRFAWEGDE